MKSYPSKPEYWREMPVVLTESDLLIGDWQVMQRWELPIMETMAEEVTANNGDILEIGFGMGLSANAIIKCGCCTYTVIEAHPKIAELARAWGKEQKIKVTVFEGFWQDIVPKLEKKYDGILFDTYPLSQEERHKNHFSFIPAAPRLLNKQGILTYYSDENINFRQEHLQLLFEYFNGVKLIKVSGLNPPSDCEYWNDSCMVIPVATKPIGL